jgi:hypothetical protein
LSPFLETVMNLLRNSLLMRKTGDRLRTELTEESAAQYGFSAEFITRSRERCSGVSAAASSKTLQCRWRVPLES